MRNNKVKKMKNKNVIKLSIVGKHLVYCRCTHVYNIISQ